MSSASAPRSRRRSCSSKTRCCTSRATTEVKLSDAEIEKLRQSGIRLGGEGRFWHVGPEATHRGMRAAFWRWLYRNPDGRWVLRLDDQRFVYLDVDDAPFVVRSARWEGERALLRLSDDSEEELD